MTEGTGFIFSAAEIREKGGLTVKKAAEPAVLDAATEPLARTVKADVELVFSVGADSLLLEGKLTAELSMECARCGAVFTSNFSETFDEVYEDAVESIDVRGPLIESVALMMPLKPLCAPGCKGLCQACGGNLNLKTCGCEIERGPRNDGARKANPFNALRMYPVPPRKAPAHGKQDSGKTGKKRPN
jgi:uncharacterized metal-binding protein YceD (DUF177 family)